MSISTAAQRRAYDPVRYRRGTRGFAALVTLINGLVVLGLGLVVLPASLVPSLALTWLVPVAIAAGILHLAAVIGLVRGRTWARSLVLYLAAAGIGVATYAFLGVVTGLDIFGVTSSLPADQAVREGAGFLLWMIGWWLVGAWFAYTAFTSHRPTAVIAPVVAPAASPVSAQRAVPAPRLSTASAAA